MKNITIVKTLLFSLSCLFAGCADPDYETPTPSLNASVATSNVLVVNAVPGSAALTRLAVDNIPVTGPLPSFTQAFPAQSAQVKYLAIPAGNRQIRAELATVAADAVASSRFNTGQYYSYFITDTLNRPQDRDQYIIRPLIIADNLSAPAAGKARVRFLHLSPNAPEVGVYNTLTRAVVFSPRRYRETARGSGATRSDFTAFTQVDAGTYALDVRTLQTAAPVLVLPAVTFEAGKIYTVFARGLVGRTGEQALGASVIVHN